MPSKRCYYEVLEVPREVDEEGLKKSYRKLAMQYHPDRNVGHAEAEIKFKEVTEAFEVLRDPQKRQRYDRYGHAGLEGMMGPGNGVGPSVMDMFGDLFDGFLNGGSGRRRRGPQKGRDLQTAIEIDLAEAFRGTTREVKVQLHEACSTCAGTGAKPGTQAQRCSRCHGHGVVLQQQGIWQTEQTCRACRGRGVVIADPCPTCRGNRVLEKELLVPVSVPPGADNDTMLQVPGKGEPGEPGAPPGDLYCVIHVRPHSLFVRNGQELHCEIPITISQAALGGGIEVPTLEGKFIHHTLPRGIQSQEQFTIRGKGMPHVRNASRRGDLIVHVRIVTPRSLTKRQEELLRELDALDGKHVSAEKKSFFDRVRDFFSATGQPAEPTAPHEPTA
jgi:molecular chaperone DnaJ